MPSQLSDRFDYSACFDSVLGQAVLFGGGSLGLLHNDTWTWDGTSWTLAATTGPSRRRASAITYDAARQRVVLVGGLGDFPIRYQDHWEWDGAQWSQVHATVPWGVYDGGLGYDRVRSRLVHISFWGDTYEHDGTNWNMVDSGANSPSRLELTWVGSRQALQTVLWYGAGLPYLSEWNGSQWITLRQLSGVNVGHFLCYDSDRNVLLDYHRDGLETTTTTVASTTAFGSSCGGQQIRTTLTAGGVPRPGDDAFHLDLRSDATLRPAAVGLATGSTQVPLGNGCELLLLDPFASYVWFVDQHGVLHLPVSIPDRASLRGLEFTCQGAVLDRLRRVVSP